MNQPRVSVVLTTYNRPDVLPNAIRSVLNQTYPHLELVIVDDASTFDSRAIIEQFEDSRIRFVRHDVNKGVAAARNTGIRMTTSEYIAFLDDDDHYSESKIERQLGKLEGVPTNVGLVYCGFNVFNDQGRHLAQVIPQHKNWTSVDCLEFPWPSALVRRECFEEVGLFDESFKCFEDWDMALRMSEKYDFRFCAEPLYVSVVHPFAKQHLGGDPQRMLKSINDFYAKHACRIKALPKKSRRRIQSTFHKAKARYLYDSGMVGEGRLEAAKCVLLSPWKTHHWKLLAVGSFGTHFFRAGWTVRRGLAHEPQSQRATDTLPVEFTAK